MLMMMIMLTIVRLTKIQGEGAGGDTVNGSAAASNQPVLLIAGGGRVRIISSFTTDFLGGVARSWCELKNPKGES
jgi:hypothetical protein